MPGGMVNPDAQRLADYLDQLHQTGYGNIDPTVQVATAQGAVNHPAHVGVMDSIKNALATGWRNVGEFFHEPSANQPATTTQQVHDHLTGTGIPSVQPPQVQQHQQQMQAHGYGKGLPANGVWSADWNAQQYQMSLDKQNQPGFGEVGVRSILGPLGDMLFSHAIPLIKSMAISTLQGIGHTAALIAQPLVDIPTGAEFGLTGNRNQPSLGDKVGAAIQSATNLLDHSGKQTAEEYMKTPAGWHDAVTVAGTALTLSSLGAWAKAGKLAVEGAAAAGAKAGATNAAKALVTPVSTEEAAAGTKTLMNSLLPQIGTDGLRRFAFTKWLQNAPTQNFTTGLNLAATKLGDYWQIARTPLVQAYRLPAVQAAGKIGVAVGNAGLKGGLIGEGEKFLGDPNGPQAQALDHLQPIAGWQGAVLNGLQLGSQDVLHGVGMKEQVGKVVGNTIDNISRSLNESGVIANWERVMRDNGYPGYRQTVNAAAQRGRPASIVDARIYDGLENQAAWHAAQIEWQHYVQSGDAKLTDPTARFAFLQNASHVIRNNPEMMNEARNSYLLTPGQYAADLQRSIVNMKSDPTYSYSNEFMDSLHADLTMHNYIMPNQQHLVSPENLSDLAAQRRVAQAEVDDKIARGVMRDPKQYDSYTKLLSQVAQRSGSDALLDIYKAVKDDTPIEYNITRNGQQVTRTIPRPASEATFLEALKDQLSKYAVDAPEWAHAPGNTAAWEADRQKIQQMRDVISAIPSLEQPPKRIGEATLSDARLAALNGDRFDGKIGYMKTERQTSGDAQAKALGFAGEYNKLNPDTPMPTEMDKWGQLPDKEFDSLTASEAQKELHSRILQYLGSELGVNIKNLMYTSIPNLIELVERRSHALAMDLPISFNAPLSLQTGKKILDDLGYKLVYGTDIGHRFSGLLPDADVLGKEQNVLQRAANILGLNFSHVDPHVAAAHADASMLNAIQDEINASETGKYPVWATADRMVGYLRGAIRPDMNLISSTAFHASASRISKVVRPIRGGMWGREINKLMEDGLTRPEAKAQIQEAITRDVGPTFWTRKEVTDALTKSGKVKNNFGETVDAPGMSVKAASDFYYAMQKGLRDTPAWVGGLNPFIKALDSSFGLAGVPVTLPNGRRLLDVTGGVKKVLMNARYQASPRFAYLRVIKSAAKGVTEDIPFTLDAAGAMKEMGITKEAEALRDYYLGSNPRAKEVSDYVNQEFDKQDMFNIYNPRAIEARNIWYLHQQALKDAGGDITKIDKKQVLKKLDDIFTYGPRTAAEKSVNAFFFPFSFEKTIARQLGGYVLDHPIARLSTLAAVNLYDSADGQQMKKWMEANLPLFKEVEKFNPFYHGIGVGQTGGILRLPEDVIRQALTTAYPHITINGTQHNPEDIARQLFTEIMSPKPITTMASAKAALALIPAMRDLNKIVLGIDPNGKKPWNPGGELKDTANMVRWEVGRGMSWLRGDAPPDNWRSRTELSYDNQMTAAWDLRSQLLTKLAPALEANRQGADYLWPNTLPDSVKGTKISAETISQLVHHVYPKWDPSLITQYVEQRRTASYAERASLEQVAPTYVGMYELWLQKADSITSLISHQAIDTKTLAQYTSIMRSYAAQLAAQDPTFAAFYKKYYQSKFGPLRGL